MIHKKNEMVNKIDNTYKSNKKKNILLKSVLILLVLFVILLIFTVIIYLKPKETKLDNILNRIDDHEQFILFITDNGFASQEMEGVIDFYKNAYELEVVKYDLISKNTDDLKKILEKVKMNNAKIEAPSLVLIGETIIILNSIISEADFNQYLLQYGYITDKKENTINYEQFKTLVSGQKKELIALFSYSKDVIKIRSNLLKLKQKYHFDYSVVTVGVGDSYFIEMDLMNYNNRRYISPPALVIVQNKKIIDYVEFNDQTVVLENFLKKNDIIS